MNNDRARPGLTLAESSIPRELRAIFGDASRVERMLATLRDAADADQGHAIAVDFVYYDRVLLADEHLVAWTQRDTLPALIARIRGQHVVTLQLIDGRSPRSVVAVRHAQAEQNLWKDAVRAGDPRFLGKGFQRRQSNEYRLTGAGVRDARTTGERIREHISATFDLYVTGPYVRTLEMALEMGFKDAQWRQLQALRERSYGYDDLERWKRRWLPHRDRRSWLQEASPQPPANRRATSPYFWRPPNGESIADVVERLRDPLNRLIRDADGGTILLSGHHGSLRAVHALLAGLAPDEYDAWVADSATHLGNAWLREYTSTDPKTGIVAPCLVAMRQIDTHNQAAFHTPWQPLRPWAGVLVEPTHSNAELRELVARFPQIIGDEPRG